MSSNNVPFDQSPPFIITQPNYNPQSGSAHGSVGPVVAVLVVVAVLGMVAAIIGRLCTGKRIMGYGHNCNMESWAETKCSSCIDGRIHVPPPRSRTVGGNAQASVLTPVQAQAAHQETEQSDQHSPHIVPPNACS
ncbi:uncharacterized protein LOC116215224 [Punica granatum]|uniref:Uncharacterized protein n=2 Tax=Punica granatum TaxID=22663 RepID=A0A218WEJ4_PUNGR|nr:uncharacterized protein LOC116215224 [Punica granatum]OWM70919.1 hypothetical protein CDL15_Pgr014593 [Punica granatum]PKI46117.1 hypothetical protein CRG98_033512 [Punica granatum]